MLALSIIMVTIAMPLKSFNSPASAGQVTWSRLLLLILIGSALIGIETMPVKLAVSPIGVDLDGSFLATLGEVPNFIVEDYSLFNNLLHVNSVVSVINCLLVITAAILVAPVSNGAWTSVRSSLRSWLITGKIQLNDNNDSFARLNETNPQYKEAQTEGKEFFIFSLCTVLGAIFLASCTDSLTLLLGLELQSYSVYVIAAQYTGYQPSEAAGLKYYLLGALSSAIVFMGLGILYVACGSTNFKFIAEFGQVCDDPLRHLGYIFILIGFTWKIAAAPLHNWSVDVYDAVPSKSASWLSLVPKIAIITLISDLIIQVCSTYPAISITGSNQLVLTDVRLPLLFLISVLSLVIGSIAGLTQPRIKRLLAYSGVLNVGFILLSIALQAEMGYLNGAVVGGWVLYLGQYILTTAGIWLCLLAWGVKDTSTLAYTGVGHSNGFSGLLRGPVIPVSVETGYTNQGSSRLGTIALIKDSLANSGTKDITTTTQLQGMSLANAMQQGNLMLALTLTLLLFSAAGIPPLVGFFAKYQVISLAINSGFFYISLVTILASLISSVYYLRIIRAIWSLNLVPSLTGHTRNGSKLSASSNLNVRNGQDLSGFFASGMHKLIGGSKNSDVACAKLSSWFAFSLAFISALVIVYCFQIPVIETWLALIWA